MPKRSYKTQEDISVELERLIVGLRGKGEGFLPSERELCSKVGASRETVRRALESFESRGLLIKGSQKGRAIAKNRKDGPTVVFTATGVGAIGNMTWSRIWNRLSELTAESDIRLSLALTELDREDECVAAILENPPEYLILADCPSEKAKESLLSLKGGSTIITIDMQHAAGCDYAICVDNYKAGLKAGREILKAGYKNPCYVYWKQEPPYKPFELRGEGFRDALREGGMDVGPERFIGVGEGGGKSKRIAFLVALIHTCEGIAESRFDSMFCHSDEEFDFVYQIVSGHKRVPEDFGLIAVEGRGLSLEGVPPVNALNQGEPGIAAGLLELICGLREGKRPEKKIKLIEAELKNGGKTLR